MNSKILGLVIVSMMVMGAGIALMSASDDSDAAVITGVTVGDLVYSVDTDAGTATITTSVTPSTYQGGTLPSSITYNGNSYVVTSIGYGAFNWTNMTSITIPNTITSIGAYAFQSCRYLETFAIPASVTSIGDGAFDSCRSLTSITVPNSVTSIGKSVFNGCSSMTSITIPEGITSLSDWLLAGCTSLTSFTIPSTVTQIGDGTFSACRSLTSITIPEGVTHIGEAAFIQCSGLTSITIPEGVSLLTSTFSACTSLTSITIPSTVTFIGDRIFESCRSLTSITIPEGVTSIGNYVFNNCYSLTSITIPEGVTSIGNYAFQECRSLTSITIPEGVTSIGNYAFYGCTDLTSITIPEGVTSIGNYAFGYCTELTSFTIPGTVTSIGNYAFFRCSNLIFLQIPEGATSIGNYAFQECTSLTSVTIPSTVETLNYRTFYRNTMEVRILPTTALIGDMADVPNVTFIVENPSEITSIPSTLVLEGSLWEYTFVVKFGSTIQTPETISIDDIGWLSIGSNGVISGVAPASEDGSSQFWTFTLSAFKTGYRISTQTITIEVYAELTFTTIPTVSMVITEVSPGTYNIDVSGSSDYLTLNIDYGDGFRSNAKVSQHTWAPGVYNVVLIAYNTIGNNSITEVLTVSAAIPDGDPEPGGDGPGDEPGDDPGDETPELLDDRTTLLAMVAVLIVLLIAATYAVICKDTSKLAYVPAALWFIAILLFRGLLPW